MKSRLAFLIRAALMLLVWWVFWFAFTSPLSDEVNLAVLTGLPFLVLPIVWLGRAYLERHRSIGAATWTTTFVHFALMMPLGIPLVRAIATHGDWVGWRIPVPSWIGLALVLLTGSAFLFVVANLALKGLGAPFFIALSRKVATDWLYAWTRNPMVLAGLALLVSLGLWYQSTFFILWALVIFAPALLVFVKVYEEEELAIRFGASYLAYKARTPMLFPRKPKMNRQAFGASSQ